MKKKIIDFLSLTLIIFAMQQVCGYIVYNIFFKAKWTLILYLKNPVIITFWVCYFFISGVYIGIKQSNSDKNK